MAVRTTGSGGRGRLWSFPARPEPVNYRVRPRYRWPEKTWIDVMVGKLSRHGMIEFLDPFSERLGAAYRIVYYGAEACPNVRFLHRTYVDRSYDSICIECQGFGCEHPDHIESPLKGAARWGLTRAVVGAIFAGRAVHQLNSNTVLSSDGYSGRQEVQHGERPAREEARDGRQEESEAPQTEDVAVRRTVIYAADLGLDRVEFAQERPAFVGSISVVSDGGGQRVQLCDWRGDVVRELAFEDVWIALAAYDPGEVR